jgi:YHS domain-containing protein
MGDRVEVVKGLMEGERVVGAANFLLDSESRMRAVSAGIFNPATDPVCGMEVDEQRAAAAGRTAEHAGTTFYFCADECKRRFVGNPGRFVQKPSPSHTAPKSAAKPPATQPSAVQPHPAGPDHGGADEPDTAADPICQMTVTVEDAVAAGRMSTRDGRTFYFCSDRCKKKFDEAAAPGVPAQKAHGVIP